MDSFKERVKYTLKILQKMCILQHSVIIDNKRKAMAMASEILGKVPFPFYFRN